MISLSYSRISLADIAQKLQLDSPEDAEFIVAKVPASQISPQTSSQTPVGLPARLLPPRPRGAASLLVG